MPRAGSGGGRSSSHRSSGSHSSSRSSGGHRVSSGGHSRAGSGRSSSSGFHSSFGSPYRSRGPSYHGAPPPPPPFRGPGMPPPPPYGRRRYARTYYGGGGSVLLNSIITLIVVFFIMFALVSVITIGTSGSSGSSSIPASTRNREKLNSSISFDSNCIVDELGWFDSVSRAGTRLKSFYDKTGVQPYIVLLQYHPELVTDSQKEDYALQYYEDNIDNEATFLYMYFAEEDQDNDVGYMCYVNGKQVDSVMDSEAIEIFWAYIDRSWYSDTSTDTLFADAFEMTADTIMKKSRTATDIAFVVATGVVIILILITLIFVMVTKRRHERERAEETQRILNTPLPNNPLSQQGTTTAAPFTDNGNRTS